MSAKLKILMFMASSFLCGMSMSAQDTDEIKKEINKIKKDSKYIYVESTATTEEEARLFAEEALYDEINQWVATQKKLKDKPNLLINNKKEYWTSLSMPRGTNMIRFFLYVKKSDIITTENTTMLVNEAQVQNDAETRSDVQKSATLNIPPVVKEIASYTKYKDMANKIMELKDSGRIKNYARYSSLSNPDACYLAIYNKMGNVVAILTPGANRVNIATGKSDSVKNYSGCGAIGFEI